MVSRRRRAERREVGEEEQEEEGEGVLCCFVEDSIRRKNLGEDGNGDMI